MGVANEPADGARVEPPPARREKDRVDCIAGERRPAVTEVAREVVSRLLSQRDDPLFPALAADVECFALEVDVGEIEPDGLRAPEPTGVQELEESSVSQRERVVSLYVLEQ